MRDRPRADRPAPLRRDHRHRRGADPGGGADPGRGDVHAGAARAPAQARLGARPQAALRGPARGPAARRRHRPLLETLTGRVPVFHTAMVERAFLGKELRRRRLRLPDDVDTEVLGRLWLRQRDGATPGGPAAGTAGGGAGSARRGSPPRPRRRPDHGQGVHRAGQPPRRARRRRRSARCRRPSASWGAGPGGSDPASGRGPRGRASRSR